MEMLEAMAIEVGLDNEGCPFCTETTDEVRDNDFSNDSGKLGGALDDEPDWRVYVPHPMAGDLTAENRLRTNAHHLIPADASFNPHPNIKRLLGKEYGDIVENVGYGVNHAKNGEWLPSYPEDYQQTQTKKRAITWGQMTDDFPDMQHRITVIAMQHTGKQFHDSHEGYSNFVSKCLDKICEMVVTVAADHKCGTPPGPMAKPWQPPYALRARLDNLSQRLRTMLSGSPKRWRDPVFTSSHAKRYHTTMTRPFAGPR